MNLKEQVVFQLLNVEHGQRSPALCMNWEQAAQTFKESFKEEDWEKHYILVIFDTPMHDGEADVSMRPLIHIKDFMQLLGESNNE